MPATAAPFPGGAGAATQAHGERNAGKADAPRADMALAQDRVEPGQDKGPASDDLGGMADAWVRHTRRDLGEWMDHAAAALLERASAGWSPRCTPAMVECDSHVAACAGCKGSRLSRGWRSPAGADCAWAVAHGESMEKAKASLLRAAGESIEEAKASLLRAVGGTTTNGFVDPSMVARGHRATCTRFRRHTAQGYESADPGTRVDTRCTAGVVTMAIAAAAPPMAWCRRATQDLSRTPAASRRHARRAGRGDTTVFLPRGEPPDLRTAYRLAMKLVADGKAEVVAGARCFSGYTRSPGTGRGTWPG